MNNNNNILLIHLGGLGDTCLSESTFFSLSNHFKNRIEALGNRRFLELFRQYFAQIHSIESAKWLYLFSKNPSDITWERIVFIGKDREGKLRKKWRGLSRDKLIFIDMYPEDSVGFNDRRIVHVEDYQLAQLEQYGIKPIKRKITTNISKRVVLYPETAFKKEKWHPDNFIRLYRSLKSKNIDVCLLKSLALDIDAETKDIVSITELEKMRNFFYKGGIFVSNDSGMAHFAGVCGLFTITIFSGFEPAIWHPRGDHLTFKTGTDLIDTELLEKKIIDIYCHLDNGKIRLSS